MSATSLNFRLHSPKAARAGRLVIVSSRLAVSMRDKGRTSTISPDSIIERRSLKNNGNTKRLVTKRYVRIFFAWNRYCQNVSRGQVSTSASIAVAVSPGGMTIAPPQKKFNILNQEKLNTLSSLTVPIGLTPTLAPNDMTQSSKNFSPLDR